MLSQINLNCTARTETTKRVLYLADDDPNSKLIERGPFEVNDIIPDSPQELLLNKLCSGKK
ncbi:MAG: hypothetical protein HYZ45_14550 [Burkholderiales bacterium]|nr:hypothetical protein [Burkholderiales bacterium]